MSDHFTQRATGAALLTLVALTTAALAAVPAAAATASTGAATGPATSVGAPGPVDERRLTAGVRSIEHGIGIVTLDGTGEPGAVVEIVGDAVERTQADVDEGGRWTARVPVRPGDVRVLEIRSDADDEALELEVEVLILRAPEMIAVVDGITRTIALDGTGFPGAHLVIRLASEDAADPEGGPVIGETDVADDGTWSHTLREMPFGPSHVEVWQYFDGAHNGGVDQVYTVAGNAEVTRADASRETGRTTLAGRAPAGTVLRFADPDGPVSGPDGRPVVAEVGDDLRWTAELPFRDDARLLRITVSTWDGDQQVGETDQDVVVPVAPTATVHEQPDGTIRLEGAGEPGATISLEADSGRAVLDHDGRPVSTTVGRRWSVTIDRGLLPADAVVVRQEVDGSPQGSVRVALPALPVGPEPVEGASPGPGGTRPGGAGTAARPLTDDQPEPAAAATGTLAFTGADPSAAIGFAAGLLALGAGVLLAVRAVRRRRPGQS